MLLKIVSLWQPILYNFIFWLLYVFLLHEFLSSKYGRVSLGVMVVWDLLASILSMYFHLNKIVQELLFLFPLFILVSCMYFERIQWRMVVMSLGMTLYLVPELFVQSLLYFASGNNPFQMLHQNPLYVLVIFILSFGFYLFLKDVLHKIYKSRVTQKGKVAIIMTLSVVLIALMPIAYFFDNISPFFLFGFCISGVILDVVLLEYIVRFIQICQVEWVQSSTQDEILEDKTEQLHELRHDIANYMNALKILQKQKEGNEL